MEQNNMNPVEGVVAENAKQNVVKQNAKIMGYGFVGFLVIVVLVFCGVNAYRVYAKGATDTVALTTARVLNLPALKVNGQAISYANYVDDLKAIKTLRDYTKANGGGPAANFTDEQMSDQVLVRLVNNALLNDAARAHSVVVEAKDLDALKTQIMQQFKTTADIDAELTKRYGWNMATYQEKVMKPFVLQNKLTELVQADPAGRASVHQKAEDVLKKIQAGADFAEMAKQYGQDGTATQGGDLGWFGKGEMVPQFETAVFALKKGEITPTLVETTYGYHIIQLEDRKTEKTKDASGKMVTAEKVQARHILFTFPSLNTVLDGALKQAQIKLYLKVHNPFDALLKK